MRLQFSSQLESPIIRILKCLWTSTLDANGAETDGKMCARYLTLATLACFFLGSSSLECNGDATGKPRLICGAALAT